MQVRTLTLVSTEIGIGTLRILHERSKSISCVNHWSRGEGLIMLLEVANDSLKCLEFLHNSYGNPRTIVARVVAKNERTGNLEVYYIARGEAPQSQGQFRIASYRAPIGSLAAWAVGDEGEIYTPRESKDFSLQCKARINADFSLADNGARFWDSRNTKISHLNHDDVTILSLRKFVDQFESLETSDQVVKGVRRQAITEVALRDQPILDRSQDEIFRLPISARIFLSGRPGSGKTTTLIRRLGQKADLTSLKAYGENIAILAEIEREYKINHKENWYFFSPTRPLGDYLASAIARESLSVGINSVKVWDDYSREIAAELGIIGTPNDPGMFQIKECTDFFGNFSTDTSLFDSFWRYYISAIRKTLSDVAARWSRSEVNEVAVIGKQFLHFIAENTRIVPLLREQGSVISQLGKLDGGITRGLLKGAPVSRSDWIRYIGEVYRSFREDEEYRSLIQNISGEITTREMDIVLLTYLRAANELLQHFDANGILKKIKDMRRVQVLVDEATDFSVIQLSCMYELCHPKVRSFFLCGDLNQRFASGGIRSMEELKWISNDFKILNVSRNYRQTGSLSRFADRIIELPLPLGVDQRIEAPIDQLEDDDFPLVWSDNLASDESIANWLVERINEIAVISGKEATIAVFVNSEGEIDSLAKALSERSAQIDRGVAPCKSGRVSGRNDDIRIFDVKHIRGLEFEAAFFIRVDGLINNEPNTFLNFLYVGATRAATFLGMTFSDGVPAQLRSLEGYFENSWGQEIAIA